MDPRRHHRLLVFSDGYSTEPLTDLGTKLVSEGVPLDYRLLRAPELVDYQLATLTTPTRVQPAEPFIVDLELRGNQDGIVPVTVTKNGQPIMTQNAEISRGVGRLSTTRVHTQGDRRDA